MDSDGPLRPLVKSRTAAARKAAETAEAARAAERSRQDAALVRAVEVIRAAR
jgi:hypothetical protein